MTERLQRCTVATLGAIWAVDPSLTHAAGGAGIDWGFTPDADRLGGDVDVEIPLAALSVAGAVLLFVTFSALVIFIGGRLTDRRRRRPPQSILRQGRR